MNSSFYHQRIMHCSESRATETVLNSVWNTLGLAVAATPSSNTACFKLIAVLHLQAVDPAAVYKCREHQFILINIQYLVLHRERRPKPHSKRKENKEKLACPGKKLLIGLVNKTDKLAAQQCLLACYKNCIAGW